jgi:hypothetical protein
VRQGANQCVLKAGQPDSAKKTIYSRRNLTVAHAPVQGNPQIMPYRELRQHPESLGLYRNPHPSPLKEVSISNIAPIENDPTSVCLNLTAQELK